MADCFINMDSIEFDGVFGDEIKRVRIDQPDGAGGESWSINVDGYHLGVILIRNGEYWYHDNKLYSSDVQAIVDRITDHLHQPYSEVNFWANNHKKP